MAALAMMAKSNADTSTAAAAANGETKHPAVFHNFLGGSGSDPPLISAPNSNKTAVDGPFSPTSDLGSEGQAGNQFNRTVPRNNQILGTKRSSTDRETSRAFKMLRRGPLQQMRASSASLMLQQLPRSNPLLYQLPSSRLSQIAADEGSRTGIKGSGISNFINARRVSEKLPSAMPGSSKMKPAATSCEPESSIPAGLGLTSISRQMTIIYGGQVHVFYNVHPNKAELIMSMAGSNGGFWSTTLTKAAPKATQGESWLPNGKKETGS